MVVTSDADLVDVGFHLEVRQGEMEVTELARLVVKLFPLRILSNSYFICARFLSKIYSRREKQGSYQSHCL